MSFSLQNCLKPVLFFNPIIDRCYAKNSNLYIYIKGTKEKIKKLLIFLLIYAELLFVFYF